LLQWAREENAMDVPTQVHLKPLRDALEFRLAELQAEVQAAERSRRTPVDATDVDDLEDEALREQVGDVAEAEERRDVDELGRVQGALRRLEAGVYGDCVDCGAPSGLERLRVQPAAERCASCQRTAEQRARRATA
jgi:RNA polymerase-binding transcription factor